MWLRLLLLVLVHSQPLLVVLVVRSTVLLLLPAPCAGGGRAGTAEYCLAVRNSTHRAQYRPSYSSYCSTTSRSEVTLLVSVPNYF